MPVKICGVSGGTAYSQLGATHHSLHDIAVLRTFPGMEVYLPCDVRQTRKLVERLKDHPKPVYVRVGRDAVPDVYDNDNFDLEPGKANTLMEGTDLTIIGTGETVAHCLEAGKMLKQQGINARVLDMFSIKPFDREAVLRAARETKRIVTAEEHSIYGGLGAMVAEITSQECPVRMKILGVPDENVVHASHKEIFRHYGFDYQGIYKLRYCPKAPAMLTYQITSPIRKLNGISGTFTVDDVWPGKPSPDDYPLKNHWYSDRPERNLYEGKWQGAKTIRHWRADILEDWAKRWKWIE
jgi:transketolase C-terminal domain/subunit